MPGIVALIGRVYAEYGFVYEPRVEEACVDHIKGFSYSAPYEDLKLKAGK